MSSSGESPHGALSSSISRVGETQITFFPAKRALGLAVIATYRPHRRGRVAPLMTAGRPTVGASAAQVYRCLHPPVSAYRSVDAGWVSGGPLALGL